VELSLVKGDNRESMDSRSLCPVLGPHGLARQGLPGNFGWEGPFRDGAKPSPWDQNGATVFRRVSQEEGGSKQGHLRVESWAGHRAVSTFVWVLGSEDSMTPRQKLQWARLHVVEQRWDMLCRRAFLGLVQSRRLRAPPVPLLSPILAQRSCTRGPTFPQKELHFTFSVNHILPPNPQEA
jgi:hypothetical protein